MNRGSECRVYQSCSRSCFYMIWDCSPRMNYNLACKNTARSEPCRSLAYWCLMVAVIVKLPGYLNLDQNQRQATILFAYAPTWSKLLHWAFSCRTTSGSAPKSLNSTSHLSCSPGALVASWLLLRNHTMITDCFSRFFCHFAPAAWLVWLSVCFFKLHSTKTMNFILWLFKFLRPCS